MNRGLGLELRRAAIRVVNSVEDGQFENSPARRGMWRVRVARNAPADSLVRSFAVEVRGVLAEHAIEVKLPEK